MPKKFSLRWLFESFEDHPTFSEKRMFGGLAAYLHGRMVMVLTESPGDKSYKGKNYPFEIWNGVLVPTERDYHLSLKTEFPALLNHPVLPKWLFLPLLVSDFETAAEKIVAKIVKDDERIGIYPKKRSLRKPK